MRETGLQLRPVGQQGPGFRSFMLNGLTDLNVGGKFPAGEGGEGVTESETSMEWP